MSMLRDLMKNKAIMAAASILFGIYLIIARSSALYTVIRILGYGLLGTALVYLVYYFGDRERDRTSLMYAAAAGVAGLLIMMLAPSIVNFFPVLAGILLILSGVSDLLSLRGHADGKAKILPVVLIILGLLVVTHPGAIAGAVVAIAGGAFILNGLTDLNIIRKLW